MDSTELVDPLTGRSWPGPVRNETRDVPSGALLMDEWALVLGGVSDQGAILDTAEVHVPRAARGSPSAQSGKDSP